MKNARFGFQSNILVVQFFPCQSVFVLSDGPWLNSGATSTIPEAASGGYVVMWVCGGLYKLSLILINTYTEQPRPNSWKSPLASPSPRMRLMWM